MKHVNEIRLTPANRRPTVCDQVQSVLKRMIFWGVLAQICTESYANSCKPKNPTVLVNNPSELDIPFKHLPDTRSYNLADSKSTGVKAILESNVTAFGKGTALQTAAQAGNRLVRFDGRLITFNQEGVLAPNADGIYSVSAINDTTIAGLDSHTGTLFVAVNSDRTIYAYNSTFDRQHQSARLMNPESSFHRIVGISATNDGLIVGLGASGVGKLSYDPVNGFSNMTTVLTQSTQGIASSQDGKVIASFNKKNLTVIGPAINQTTLTLADYIDSVSIQTMDQQTYIFVSLGASGGVVYDSANLSQPLSSQPLVSGRNRMMRVVQRVGLVVANDKNTLIYQWPPIKGAKLHLIGEVEKRSHFVQNESGSGQFTLFNADSIETMSLRVSIQGTPVVPGRFGESYGMTFDIAQKPEVYLGNPFVGFQGVTYQVNPGVGQVLAPSGVFNNRSVIIDKPYPQGCESVRGSWVENGRLVLALSNKTGVCQGGLRIHVQNKTTCAQSIVTIQVDVREFEPEPINVYETVKVGETKEVALDLPDTHGGTVFNVAAESLLVTVSLHGQKLRYSVNSYQTSVMTIPLKISGTSQHTNETSQLGMIKLTLHDVRASSEMMMDNDVPFFEDEANLKYLFSLFGVMSTPFLYMVSKFFARPKSVLSDKLQCMLTQSSNNEGETYRWLNNNVTLINTKLNTIDLTIGDRVCISVGNAGLILPVIQLPVALAYQLRHCRSLNCRDHVKTIAFNWTPVAPLLFSVGSLFLGYNGPLNSLIDHNFKLLGMNESDRVTKYKNIRNLRKVLSKLTLYAYLGYNTEFSEFRGISTMSRKIARNLCSISSPEEKQLEKLFESQELQYLKEGTFVSSSHNSAGNNGSDIEMAMPSSGNQYAQFNI